MGEWFDADSTLYNTFDEYRKEHTERHEEWIVHDYEGFGPYRLGEVCVSLAQKAGEFIEEYGIAGAILLSHFNDDYTSARALLDDGGFFGSFDSIEDFASEYLDSIGQKFPEWIEPYFDFERYGEMLTSGDFFSVEHDGTFYIFRNQ